MAKKKTEKQKAKDKAWEAFSKYIRYRDCLSTTGTLTEGSCVTCKRRYSFNDLQAGHFIPGRNNAVLFDEQGVHAQCKGCNLFKGGAVHEYWLFMEETYGREVIDAMITKRHTTVKMSLLDYQNIVETYNNKTKALTMNA